MSSTTSTTFVVNFDSGNQWELEAHGTVEFDPGEKATYWSPGAAPSVCADVTRIILIHDGEKAVRVDLTECPWHVLWTNAADALEAAEWDRLAALREPDCP